MKNRPERLSGSLSCGEVPNCKTPTADRLEASFEDARACTAGPSGG